MEVIKIKFNKNNITEQHSEVEVCFKCSACSKFCPITLNVEKYDPEDSFIAQLFSAEKPEALNDVWMCCACEKCVITCPQDADPTEVFTNLKQMSYQQGLAPEIIYNLVKQVIKTGSTYEVSRSANALRKKVGLKDLEFNGQVSEELKIIANKTGLELKEEGD